MNGEVTRTISTSKNSAFATRIVLERTEQLQLSFDPEIVDNTKSPEKSVKGKLVFQKKGKNDVDFPYESKVTRGSVTKGNYIELQFDTSGT
jgi:hypothetical protein